jgi:hypothetical protein
VWFNILNNWEGGSYKMSRWKFAILYLLEFPLFHAVIILILLVNLRRIPLNIFEYRGEKILFLLGTSFLLQGLMKFIGYVIIAKRKISIIISYNDYLFAGLILLILSLLWI